ncbi:increased rDNA silencing protein 4 [[Candida] railenensis]|uniref:Increased rDNA silencing protein 4 n=1 Tax=[Candida] railenensis TaxID=45579 RepID=A0A9P0VXW5_9ASCO|nr:increased rDNA silencing protein 4 [[Candida] railenensis]
MSSSSHAAALAAFQGIGNKSKSEILHDKKNPQKFQIPTESSRAQSSNTGSGPPASSSGAAQMVRRTSTASSQFKRPSPVAKASTTGQLKSTPKLHIDLNSIGKDTSSTYYSPKGVSPMHPNPSKLPHSHQQLQRSDTTSTASLALAAATVSASSNNSNTNTADYPPSTPKGINYHRSIPASSSVSVYSQDSSSIDYFNLHSNPNSNTSSTPAQHHQSQLKKSSSQHSNLSTNDMIQKVKKSIESRMVNSDGKSPKANSSSLDMINQIKNSINSKSKAASQSTTELSQRNQDRLNEIRDSIDMKRIHTPRVTSIDPSNSSFVGPPTSSPLASTPLLSPIASHRNGSGSASISGSSSPVLAPRGPGDFERNAFHNSYSSIGSSIHSSGSELVSILANQQGRVSTERITESPMKENAPTIMVEHPDNNDGEPVIVQSSGSLPGSVPGLGESLSGSAVLLNEQQHSRATPMKLAGSEDSNPFSYYNDSASMMSTLTENDKKVLRRKPPPMSQDDFDSGTTDYASDSPSLNPNKPFILPDASSGRQSFEEVQKYAHYQQEDSSTTKFPQFPGLSQHKKNKSKSNIHMKESDYKDNESEEDETSEIETEQPNSVMLETHGSRQQIVKPVQKVQLKTTMRKTNKKKEKKLTFNENKPWKNHTDLSYITEQERKRYEGVWVSNKGLYLSSVVTKLVGVDYGSDSETAPETAPLTKEETSLAAARLSSKLREETNLEDNFHNQTSAELSQLIHGVVVKRIWLRSRLPTETLKGIWALVDFRHDGTLNKAEFLAGMWFVDQCLYGRKLPKKVDAAVWDSLGSIGLNVVVKKKGRR